MSEKKFICYEIKKKIMFLYSAVSSPLERSKRFTLFAFPDRPVHSNTNSASPGGILARQQLRATTNHSHVHHCLDSQVLIFTAESTEASWRERKCQNFETVAKGIRTRALSIASPAFYHSATALQNEDTIIIILRILT